MTGLKLWEVLKALDEGKKVQYYDTVGEEWCEPLVYSVANLSISIKGGTVYRVKPEVEVKEFLGYVKKDEMFLCIGEQEPVDTHKITIEFEDGEPICESIRMEKI
jgi:hypothetical protein